MIHIQSPFIHEVSQRKPQMRKLRKKIYKYTSTHQTTKKPKDSIHNILSLLKPRNLPNFLIDPLKKRRNLDLTTIKNVIVPQGASFTEVVSMTSKQETEIEKLIEQNRGRLKNMEKRGWSKIEKKQTFFEDEEISSFSLIYGSGEEKDSGRESVEKVEEHEIEAEEEDGLFRSNGFFSLQRDPYYGQEWLRL